MVAASLATTVLADYSNTVASLNPIGYWRLNEATAPPSDLATNLGTLGAAGSGYYVAGATHAVQGALVAGTDTAANFPNTDGNRVAVPFHPAMAVKQPFSVEFWASPSTQADFHCPVALTWFGGDGARSGWLFYQNGAAGWIFRTYGTNNTGFTAQGDAPVTAGTWYHVVGVYDGTNTTLFVNGQQKATVAASNYQPITTTNVPFTVGARGNGSAGFFNFGGGIDEVAYYTNVLSTSEILAHYQNGVSATPATAYSAGVLAKNPLLYLRLNEPSFFADESTLPVAKNLGSLGTEADARYLPGSGPGRPGVPYGGMGAGNLGTYFAPEMGGYISAGTSEALNFYWPFTVITWFKGDPTDTRFKTFIGKGDSSWRAGVDGDGKARFAYGGNGDVTSSMVVNDGKWHQLAGVYDGAKLYMYIDGRLNGTGNAATLPQGSSAPMLIGSVPDYAAGRLFQGSMDEVAVFDKVLTAEEIAATFYAAEVPPYFTQQPTAPATVSEGQSIVLTGAAFGTPTIGYQWLKGTAALAGKTAASLTLNNLQLADSGSYSLVASNSYGAVTSSIVTLAVQAGPPIVVTDPTGSARYAGQTAKFKVEALGSLPLTFEWLKGGAPVSGGSTDTLTLSPLQAAMAGDYACKITNPYGSVTSKVATLTVVTAPTTSYPAKVLADSPIAFWRLGETTGTKAYDYVGGFNGTYTNTLLGQPGYATADPDKAATFGPAINSHVADITGIGFATNTGLPSFTIEAWVKGGGQTTDAGIVTKGTGAGGEQFNIDTGAGNHAYRFFVRNAGGGAVLCSSSVVPNGDWQHVVAVCDGTAGTLTLYVDGSSAATANIGTTVGILSTTSPLTIGSRQSGIAAFDNQFAGSVDEVAVYDKALDANKVYEHFYARHAAGSLPAISVQPVSATNYVSLTTLLSVTADGPDGLSYQWRRNGVNVDIGYERTLTLSALEAANGGDYTVVVSNPYGSVTSSVAKLTVLPVPASVDLSEGLVMHLPFDGDLVDTSGRGNSGTNVGATLVGSGVIGSGSLRYSTDNDAKTFKYVTLGQRPDLKFSSNVNFSVAYWIKLPIGSRRGDLPVLCSAVGSAFSPGYTFAPSYNEGGWSWTLNGTGVYGAQDSINDGAWHHVAHTFNRSGNGVTYLDGVQVDSRSVAGVGDIDQAAPTNIGQDPNGTYGETGEADVDDMGVWRRVLTPLEVGAMYVAGRSNGVSFASAPVTLSVTKSGGQLQFTWPGSGTLQGAGTVSGAFTNITGAASPYSVAPSAAEGYFRVKIP